MIHFKHTVIMFTSREMFVAQRAGEPVSDVHVSEVE